MAEEFNLGSINVTAKGIKAMAKTDLQTIMAHAYNKDWDLINAFTVEFLGNGITTVLEGMDEKIKINRKIINEDEVSLKRIDTIIDLNVEAYISDDYFSSELDKINFYREIESIRDIEDLDNLINDFKEIS